jgi:BlaI family penicillinase repressor
MASRHDRLPDLSPAQREIMEIVWGRGEVTATEVLRVLMRKRKVTRNTVRTLLERMEEKGWLKHKSEGRTFLYTAACPRSMSILQKVHDVIDTVCSGSAETLVAALLDYRGLEADELNRIRRMLDDAKAGKSRKGPHR